MSQLFPFEPDLPAGFSYFPDFITAEEEAYLAGEIDKLKLSPMIFQGFEAKRKTESFGLDYSFENRKLKQRKPIPPAFKDIIVKVAAQTGMAPGLFAEILLTEYPPGSVINWHRDAPPFDMIAGISLLADCTFRLRPYDKARQHRRSVISRQVKARSLYLMSGEAREEWQHSISPVKARRYSITMRTLKT